MYRKIIKKKKKIPENSSENTSKCELHQSEKKQLN